MKSERESLRKRIVPLHKNENRGEWEEAQYQALLKDYRKLGAKMKKYKANSLTHEQTRLEATLPELQVKLEQAQATVDALKPRYNKYKSLAGKKEKYWKYEGTSKWTRGKPPKTNRRVRYKKMKNPQYEGHYKQVKAEYDLAKDKRDAIVEEIDKVKDRINTIKATIKLRK